MKVLSSKPFTDKVCTQCSAFSLLELVVSVSLMTVLLTVVFALRNGVFFQSKEVLAQSELALISVILSEYRDYYGSYPSLVDVTPKKPSVLLSVIMDFSDLQSNPRVDAALEHLDISDGCIVDPWGNAYGYIPEYNMDSGYILFSAGSDGGVDFDQSRMSFVANSEVNLDNIILTS